MATVTFTNNLGTVTFENAMIAVADEWSWRGGVVRHVKRIRVSTVIVRQTAASQTQGLDALTPGDSETGERGTLILPWTTLENIRYEGADYPTSAWLNHQRITVDFTDDDPDDTRYTVDFFGLTLHNPRFSMRLPFSEVHDQVVQMPLATGLIDVDDDLGFSPIRTLLTHDIMVCELSGIWQPPAGTQDMQQVVQQLSQRLGTTAVGSGSLSDRSDAELPSGYPRVFDMVEISPRLADAVPLRMLWVSGAQMDWDFVNDQASVRLQMVCPPQSLP